MLGFKRDKRWETPSLRFSFSIMSSLAGSGNPCTRSTALSSISFVHIASPSSFDGPIAMGASSGDRKNMRSKNIYWGRISRGIICTQNRSTLKSLHFRFTLLSLDHITLEGGVASYHHHSTSVSLSTPLHCSDSISVALWSSYRFIPPWSETSPRPRSISWRSTTPPA